MVREKGSPQQKQLILGAAFKSGLEKVTVPIFEYGIPVEYELVRSINTVASGSRKRIGIVNTDARLFGGAVMNGMSMQQVNRHPLIDELSKQYEVEEVDLDGPVAPGMYQALIAVQPSSLAPPQFERLVEAVKAGVPTAIFEDPAPVANSYITPTGSPKQSPGGMFGGGGPSPKGDIRQLWEALEIECPGRAGMQGMYSPDLVWHQHNPYPNLDQNANELWIFVDQDAPGAEPGQCLSDDSPITSGMQEVLAIVSGAVEAAPGGTLKRTPILMTGAISGLINGDKLRAIMTGQSALRTLVDSVTPNLAIAMTIEGEEPAPTKDKDAEGSEEASETSSKSDPIRAVYVADTDLMIPEFLMIRADPDQVSDARFQFQNVTFILNCIDWLTAETDFIDVRKHEPIFASLRMIDSVKEEARSAVRRRSREFQDQSDEDIRDAQEAMDQKLKTLREELEKLQKENQEGRVDRAKVQAIMQRFETERELEQRKLDVKRTKTERERDRKIQDIEREAAQEVTDIQNQVKAAAVVLPCIPPLIVGIIVFASRRLRERENISKSRLK